MLRFRPQTFIVGLCFCLLSIGAYGEKKALLIVHTNDIHSQILPTDRHETLPDLGGALRRQALIDSLRHTGKAVLLVDAGDAVQGTAFYPTYHGAAEMALMNHLGYDFITPGNHEFDYGPASLAAMYAKAQPTIVNCNYGVSGTPLEGCFSAGVIKEIGGWKVGITGVGVDLKTLVDPQKNAGVVYRDAIAAASRTADSLKRHGAEIVVVLSHLGIDDDRKLARSSRAIDIIIGGHSHTLLPAPLPVINQAGEKVLIGQTGKRGLYVGVIECQENSRQGYLIDLSARYDGRADSTTAALIESYRRPMEERHGEVVGESPVTLTRKNDLPDLTAEALVQQARREGWHCDFGIINPGAMRCDLGAGEITRGDILACYPFENRLCYIALSGKEVKRLFKIIAAVGRQGVSREVECVVTPGKRIKHLTIGGEKISHRRLYHIATTDYLANGGSDLTPLARCRQRIDTEMLLCDLMARYIGEITAKREDIRNKTSQELPHKKSHRP